MFNKKITVVITSYNSEKYLKDSILSVLNQTYKNFELIIVDDGSIDNSRKIINSFKKKDKRVRTFFFKKNIGLEAFARNYAIKKSQGEYISFLDADDFWLDTKLETQINHLRKNTVMCSTLCTYIDNKGNPYSSFFTNKARKFIQNLVFKLGLKGLYIYNPFILSSVIIKKDILIKYYFDEDKFIVGVADLKLWLNILRNNSINQISLINFFLVKIRRRKDSLNINYTQASTRAIYAISNFFLYHKDYKNFYLFVIGILFRALKLLYKLLYYKLKNFLVYILFFLFIFYFLFFISPFPWYISKNLVKYDSNSGQALVILSGNGDNDYINTGYQKRYLDAKILLKQNTYKKIFLIGREQEIPEYEILRSLIVFDGFDKNNIVILNQVGSTSGNLQLIYQNLKNEKITSFNFLTAPYHTKRCSLIWKKNNYNIDMFVANNIDNPLYLMKWNYSYKELKIIFYEYIATLYNKLLNRL
jgi:teichuronic acid biosynthesis glycosyltransferase TuaG